jgi:light-regulated signal transduction histidine kinase (bacteriophytochrome)/HAMP domain-containing protein
MYVRAGLSAKEALANANRALIYNIAMLLPFVAVAFVFAFLGGKRSIVDRITKLQNAAKNFADGNLETRVASQVEGGELGELARAFDDMASRVSMDIARRQAAEDEVRTLNADLETRVNARTAELKKLNSELETFCYSISHELRGPIARLEGFSAVIQDLVSDPDPESLAHIARRIEASSSKLKIVVDSLLEMNRISRAELKREDVLLSEMCMRISAELCEHSERENLKVSIDPDMVVKGDSTMLEVCMQNLLGNAVKYTAMAPEAAIEVGQLTRQGETVYFVKDNGAGFDMEYSNKLFQPFCRLHAENEFEGFGIGLATVERIIDKHGGRIWAESTIGHGATFYFTLG